VFRVFLARHEDKVIIYLGCFSSIQLHPTINGGIVLSFIIKGPKFNFQFACDQIEALSEEIDILVWWHGVNAIDEFLKGHKLFYEHHDYLARINFRVVLRCRWSERALRSIFEVFLSWFPYYARFHRPGYRVVSRPQHNSGAGCTS
jgi:hypothetical protein